MGGADPALVEPVFSAVVPEPTELVAAVDVDGVVSGWPVEAVFDPPPVPAVADCAAALVKPVVADVPADPFVGEPPLAVPVSMAWLPVEEVLVVGWDEVVAGLPAAWEFETDSFDGDAVDVDVVAGDVVDVELVGAEDKAANGETEDRARTVEVPDGDPLDPVALESAALDLVALDVTGELVVDEAATEVGVVEAGAEAAVPSVAGTLITWPRSANRVADALVVPEPLSDDDDPPGAAARGTESAPGSLSTEM